MISLKKKKKNLRYMSILCMATGKKNPAIKILKSASMPPCQQTASHRYAWCQLITKYRAQMLRYRYPTNNDKSTCQPFEGNTYHWESFQISESAKDIIYPRSLQMCKSLFKLPLICRSYGYKSVLSAKNHLQNSGVCQIYGEEKHYKDTSWRRSMFVQLYKSDEW